MAFRVLIIGGSVAGLTLANILEQYGIDYLLLEKYDAIAPQLGASIALLPYGMQIMDQIGLLNRLLDIGEGVDCTLLRGPAAERLKDFDMFGDWLEELFGTRMTFMERQQLVQVLYDHLKDKSKVLTSCAVQTIDQTDGQVQVTTTNGDVFSGQLVVGADGVHSRVREEMWRHEAMSNLRFDVEEMRRSITCTYRCMFGISPKPEQHILNHTFKVYHHNASYLCADGPMGNMYWFAFFKNERQTTGRDIPRYTAEDEAALLAERGGDALFNDIKFKDLYESRSRATLVPLEEFVLEKSFHKRVVLIGDSFHKMLPLIGHGGNSAIESAALLADLLMDELQQNKSPPTNASIERALSTFDRRRRPRTRALQQASLDLQQLEALEDPVKKFMMLRVASSLPFEKLALLGYIQSVTPSHTLHYLPAPTRKGRFPFTDGGVQVDERPTSVTLTSCILLLTLALIGYFTSQKAISDSIIPVYALWVVESYRPAFLLSPLSL
ncbi:FAD/NAD(P)-binding domain-containing protein [Aspergillus ellipticus CBS 707.79]|uniref:FAD/NAD(P)-binding domain-containing protein n=1 Tax=Aspergillus ellipticus CBS 707.79 TaxID=1448320 RepID=A0A319D7K4_9EURO|nr:FAD/NAD(P)-binding domain-containing protein [Aspergillus ellipticus CBS 707.79]